MEKYFKKTVLNHRWLDADTYIVIFDEFPTADDFGERDDVNESMVMVFHKNTGKWESDKIYYDAEGNELNPELAISTDEDDAAEYMAIAQEYYNKQLNN